MNGLKHFSYFEEGAWRCRVASHFANTRLDVYLDESADGEADCSIEHISHRSHEQGYANSDKRIYWRVVFNRQCDNPGLQQSSFDLLVAAQPPYGTTAHTVRIRRRLLFEVPSYHMSAVKSHGKMTLFAEVQCRVYAVVSWQTGAEHAFRKKCTAALFRRDKPWTKLRCRIGPRLVLACGKPGKPIMNLNSGNVVGVKVFSAEGLRRNTLSAFRAQHDPCNIQSIPRSTVCVVLQRSTQVTFERDKCTLTGQVKATRPDVFEYMSGGDEN